MIQQPTASTEQDRYRILCDEKKKLIATADRQGLWVWCMYCKRPEFISKEVCIAAWERGESVQCVVEQVA